ncbi:MAG TPA: Fur family transcriptional regulator [Egibacteraceae bacterium]|nr:Fur family transcriptional regulator [Egibacteraceae bacterium]
MTVATDADQALREAGLRATRQRLSVLSSLRDRPDAVTAQDLHAELRAAGDTVGLTTVYRTLTALADAGFLDVFTRDGEQAFRLCGDVHHHHLVCETCNRVEELAADEVERWVNDAAARHGFTPTGHRADIFGICARCR